jgi:excisionase family DNA binding protein
MEGEIVLLKRQEMAEKLRISTRKLADLTKAGVLPSIKIGGSVRYDPASVFAALKLLERQEAHR